MHVHETALAGVLLIEPEVHADERGYLIETWSRRRGAAHGLPTEFVQDNVSRSIEGALRGLHLQSPPAEQGKLVYVLDGEVFDVAVDLRLDSATFGRWTGERLSSQNRRQLYIPQGFAHGFCVLSREAVLAYKCTEYYVPDAQLSVRWDDPTIGIDWPVAAPLLSPRDATAPYLAEIPRERLPRMDGRA